MIDSSMSNGFDRDFIKNIAKFFFNVREIFIEYLDSLDGKLG